MDRERWQRVKQILDDLESVESDHQAEALAKACGDDSTLRWDVERFLAFDEVAEDFIEDPAWKLVTDPALDSWHPGNGHDPERAASKVENTRIGPYRVERKLGQGGMGEVFLATREDDYEQQVAIKTVSAVGGREIQSRFLNERQILASLDHPGIARLLDGGTTTEGKPYFVMEYVEGEPIDVYCDRQPLERRLELFCKVCDAVQHAHQSLIVHRDLKAGNILVNAEGDPRLLDFGIAKLLETDELRQRFATSPGQSPMTPAYASPEQLLNEPITTASDVYALGILLYRLLTGFLPYDVKGLGYAGMVRVICLKDPMNPSSRVRPPSEIRSAVAEGEALPQIIPPRRLRRRLLGDLDAIVMKALRKEPQERYRSAAELASDIRCHLEGLPVLAHKGNWLYLTTKFVRRNTLALVVGSLVLASAISSTVLWRQAEDERAQAVVLQREAERQQQHAERVTDLMQDLLKSADPERARGADLTVAEVLEHGRQQFEEDLADEPSLHAQMLGTLGSVYESLGLYDEALEMQEMAVDLSRRADPPDNLLLAILLSNLGSAYYTLGDYSQAEPFYREALGIRRTLGDPPSELATLLYNFASLQRKRGKLAEAESLHREILETRLDAHGPESVQVASSLYSLGAIYLESGNLELAESHLRQALELRRNKLGDDSVRVAQVWSSLARTLQAQGQTEASRQAYEQALEIRLRAEGEDHPNYLGLRRRHAEVLLEQGAVTDACAEVADLEARWSRVEASNRSADDRAALEALAQRCAPPNV